MPTVKPLLLIIDDDPLISESLSFAFSKEFDVISSHSRQHARSLLTQLRQPPQLALIDLGLPPHPHRPDEGFALISELLAHAPEMKIIVLSGQNDQDNARHARTLGAIDFVGKPCDPSHLLALFRQALSFGNMPPTETSGLIGNSPPIQRLRTQLIQFANLDFPVLIEGESGTGKDIVASHHLHRLTKRTNKPFLALNCAAISPNLLEPTLFGHTKGAFTGANSSMNGYFEDANNGTLFLDEVGELPLELQPKLLRVLENGEFQRVGETNTRISNARVIAATNRDLRQEIRNNRFRADLFHRLSVFTVAVPPLREMGDDRKLLLDHFRVLYAEKIGQPPFNLTPEAEISWLQYSFPGNARELRNIAIRLTARYAGQQVNVETLLNEFEQIDLIDQNLPIYAPAQDLSQAKRTAHEHLSNTGNINLDATLALMERGYIEAAIENSAGNISQAARQLGINRTTLYNRLEGWSRR